jgi:hypothetical protein
MMKIRVISLFGRKNPIMHSPNESIGYAWNQAISGAELEENWWD